MKDKLICMSIICALTVAGSLTWAESQIPSLVGKWRVHAEGGMLITGDKPSPTTHPDKQFDSFDVEVVIEKQKGRVFMGFVKSKKATERICGVIGHDNKTYHYVDSDGFADGKIVTPDKLEGIYRHTKPTDRVAAVVTYTRQK